MTFTLTLSLLLMLIGALVFLFAQPRPRSAQELGRLTFMAGVFALAYFAATTAAVSFGWFDSRPPAGQRR